MRRSTRAKALTAALILSFAGPTLAADRSPDDAVSHFTLANGMEVVVIPDHRAPIVTHMVWYKIGSADEPAGKSGIAHFFEHLMFKGTKNHKAGEFGAAIAAIGGSENAFTSYDYTAYHQTVEADALETMMTFESDRMRNLILTDEVIGPERDVILEERRSRIENNPAAIMDEQMNAALFLSHPYGIPVIGWEHEMAKLSQHDAMTFYKHFYAPNNAVLVVAGDVTADDVRRLAEKTYGAIPSNPTVDKARQRPSDPPQRAARRVEYSDPRAGKASFHRDYVVPSYMTAQPGEAEALDLMMKIVGDGATSRIYKRLVVEEKIASSAGGGYQGSGLDYATINLYAIAANPGDLPKIEASINKVLEDVRENGVTEAELKRARSSYIADYIYENDDQASLARRYGWGLSLGRTVQQIEGWPDALSKVTVDDIKRAAAAYLDLRRSVTGYLTPSQARAAEQPAPKSRS